MNGINNKAWEVTFDQLPKTLEALKQLPEASLKEAYYAVALLIAALSVWPLDKVEAIEMINFLKGVESLSTYEIQFISERLRNKDYLPTSYLKGSSPENSYQASQPYTVKVMTVPSSYDENGYVKFYLQSSGADNPRPVSVRLKPSTGEWFLWDQMLLADIRIPKAADPWA